MGYTRKNSGQKALHSFRIPCHFLFIFTFIFLLFSCITQPQTVNTGTYIPKGWTAPKAAATAAELAPIWERYAQSIEYFAGQVEKPRMNIWALKVDLTDPDIEIVINEQGWEKGVVSSTTVPHFVEFRSLVAGINANPFSPVSSKEGELRTVTGLAMSDGIEISPADDRYDTLLIYDDGLAAIVNQLYLPYPQFIRQAVSGFHMVLGNGEVPEALLENKDREIRSAVGLNIMGDELYMVAVGGGGATLADLGLILKQLGAVTGLNLDGGGSTQLALRWPDGKVDNINKGGNRAVAICLGIRLRNSSFTGLEAEEEEPAETPATE
jgi:hypothetical protein